jgi:L,D-transpeptidase YcbB
MKTVFSFYVKSTFPILISFLLFGSVSTAIAFDNPDERISQLVEQYVHKDQISRFFPDENVREELYDELVNFYNNRGYQLAWYTSKEPLALADSLIFALQHAYVEGLNPRDYNLSKLKEATQIIYNARFEDEDDYFAEVAKLDILTSAAYLTFASHLLSGKVDPSMVNARWISYPRQKELGPYMEQAISDGNVIGSLRDLNPDYEKYYRLRNVLAEYREIEERGGWPHIDYQGVLSMGDSSEVVKEVKERLLIYGCLSEDALIGDEAYVFGEELEEAVKVFQNNHGLSVDGLVGPQTLRVMNVPVTDRIQQIEINMERVRWQPESYGDRYILINVPEYHLWVYDHGEEVLDMRVIVGREYTSTPIFRDVMEYLEFSPTWTVPRSIAIRMLLPRIQEDSTYFDRNHYVVYESWDPDAEKIDPLEIDWEEVTPQNFNYRIVQQPGPHNSMGLVKFMFPNPMAIYLHDTPQDYLFDRDQREFSNGCVRVEKPIELAKYLLDDQPGWDKQRITDNMHRGNPKVVTMNKTVYVQFIYQTAIVDDEGLVHFRKDIYNHDQQQIDLLERDLAGRL